MFEVGSVYANRKGEYTVLAINGPKMHVRYIDGTHANLNMRIQKRIWDNIVAEREQEKANRRTARKGTQNKHFIKVVSIPIVNELAFPGWQEHVVMVTNPVQAARIKHSDRIIYYAIEPGTFFAVATIIGKAKQADPKKYLFNVDAPHAKFFPVDVDIGALRPDKGIVRESVELDSYPDFKNMPMTAERFLPISEDDFELVSEMLTEISEGAEEEMEEDEYEEEEIE